VPHPDVAPRFASQQRRLPRWSLPLRAWQREACTTWWKQRPVDALIVACPGAGKTRFALRLSHALIDDGTIDRLLVVVPKEHLKGQFARSAHGVGLALDPSFANSAGRLASDMHGAVVTYQQVAAAPSTFRRISEGARTLILLDEIHHAGDQATWGKALREAFTGAAHRVSLSGTPFRSDGSAIPFITYDRGLCVSDYAYTYGNALRDRVCRPLVFSLHGGVAEWVSRDGTSIEASFDTALADRRQSSERLRTALTQDGWIGDVLRSAHERLASLRAAEHPRAGGLAIGMNQEHARFLADLLHQITGTAPVVVVSEDDEASRHLRRFAGSQHPWIVAVHMVSEGVDIPRLRVGVYASNVATPMYFRQFCGRFVRTEEGLRGEQHAFIFMPDDPGLRPHAAAIHLEVEGHLKGKREYEGQRAVEVSVDAITDDFYQPIAAQATARGVLHGDPSLFDMTGETEGVNRISASLIEERHEKTTPQPRQRFMTIDDIDDGLIGEKRALRREINTLVARVREQFSVDHRHIHGTLNSRFGGTLGQASREDLERRRGELMRWLTRRSYDGFR